MSLKYEPASEPLHIAKQLADPANPLPYSAAGTPAVMVLRMRERKRERE